ncbi:hypothetical protein [Geopseudomonas aromaticivorans]
MSGTRLLIENALESIRQSFEPHRFTAGDSHALAQALHQRFGGTLTAILRHQVDETDEPCETTYSHMVLALDGEEFDIDGADASQRWMEQWPEGEVDKCGMTTEFEFVMVEPSHLPVFLEMHRARCDEALVAQLAQMIASASPEAPQLDHAPKMQ